MARRVSAAAVACDLLTALVDSWTLWEQVAGDPETVAGSAHDVPGAAGVGMPVSWANRGGAAPPEGPRAVLVAPDLGALPRLLGL